VQTDSITFGFRHSSKGRCCKHTINNLLYAGLVCEKQRNIRKHPVLWLGQRKPAIIRSATGSSKCHDAQLFEQFYKEPILCM